MLRKGYTTRDISQILRVSLTTINRVSSTLHTQGNGYKQVVDRMLKEEKIVAFFNKLEATLDRALPPKGANWSEHYRRTAKEQISKQKAY